ncbi:Adaptin-N domain-containing protein [Salix suchowensis]|nr:Adaptin-N domain-containing protein [Salix suchowensis]
MNSSFLQYSRVCTIYCLTVRQYVFLGSLSTGLTLKSFHRVNVRRRALLAYKSLSQAEVPLVTQISTKLYKRMGDEDASVATAAILTSLALVKCGVSHPITRLHVVVYLNVTQPRNPELDSLIKIIRTTAKPSRASVKHTSTPTILTPRLALLCECFRVLRDRNFEQQLSSLTSSFSLCEVYGVVDFVGLNDQYTFLSYDTRNPTGLGGMGGGRVMQLLYSKDPLMRRKNIVVNYYQLILQSVADSSLGSADAVTRLLEIVEVQTASDGEAYAREVKELFRILEGPPLSPKQIVSEEAVQIILTHIMSGDDSYSMNCATALLTTIAETEVHAGPTLIVLVSALAVEYAGSVSVSPLGAGCMLIGYAAVVRALRRYPNDIVEHVSMQRIREVDMSSG